MRDAGESKPEFEAIVMTHHAEIHRYLHRVLSRSSDADDLAQETFLNAYRAWPRLPADANHRAWLFAIATNLCRNRARSQQRQRHAHASERVIRGDLRVGDPEEQALAEQIRARTETAVRALPFKQRTAFTLRRLHDLDYEAIGHTLDCSADSARAHVFQAMRKLRAALDDPPPRSRSERRTPSTARTAP